MTSTEVAERLLRRLGISGSRASDWDFDSWQAKNKNRKHFSVHLSSTTWFNSPINFRGLTTLGGFSASPCGTCRSMVGEIDLIDKLDKIRKCLSSQLNGGWGFRLEKLRIFHCTTRTEILNQLSK
jgi:hypothetical protein